MTRARANGEGSIFPYRNGYAAYAWVTKPNGLRARKYVYGKTRDDVHEKWIKLLQRARQGPVPTRVPTVAAYVTNWLEDVVRPNLAPTTYVKYETFSRLYIVPGIGAKRLDRLQVRDVQTWLNRVRTTCQCCAQGKDARRPDDERRCCALDPMRCCADVPSPATVRSARETLRSALASAMTDELVSRNVAAMARLPTGRARKPQAWTSEQVRSFLESARRSDDPLYAAYVLILVLGLRKGEVLGLAWSDVNLDTAELTISHQLQRVGRQLLRRDTKTQASDAVLPLPDICVTALERRQGEQPADREAAGEVWEEWGFVFTSRHGTPIDPRNFNREFTTRCRRAGVPVITVHDARRTCATLLVDLDVHPRVVMQVLRHAKFSITMEIYSKVTSAQTRDALKRLGDSLDE
jgi:integrase